MVRWLWLVFLVSLCSALCYGQSKHYLGQSYLLGIKAQQTSQAWVLIDQMNNHTNRFTASEGGKNGENIVYKKLIDIGFKKRVTGFQNFDAYTWQPVEAILEIVPPNSDFYNLIPCNQLSHNPAKTDLLATLVFQESFDTLLSLHLLDKIPIIYNTTNQQNNHQLYSVAQKIKLLSDKGAVGVICVEDKILESGVSVSATTDGNASPIPVLSISNRTGQRLIQWLNEEPLLGHLKLQNYLAPGMARNITARIPGKGKNKEKIVVGANLDTPFDDGNNVSASVGVAILLEVAKSLVNTKTRPLRDIEFVFFMGSHQGNLGVLSYLNNKHKKTIKYFINTSPDNAPSGYNHYGIPNAAHFINSIFSEINFIQGGAVITDNYPLNINSNQFFFLLEGYPILSPTASFVSQTTHSQPMPYINPASISPHELNLIVRNTVSLVWALANTDTIPVESLSESEILAYLKKMGVTGQIYLEKEKIVKR